MLSLPAEDCTEKNSHYDLAKACSAGVCNSQADNGEHAPLLCAEDQNFPGREGYGCWFEEGLKKTTWRRKREFREERVKERRNIHKTTPFQHGILRVE